MGKKLKKETETPRQDTFQPVLVECQTPDTMVLLLSSTEKDILVKACEALFMFAEKGDENKVSLLDLGALEPLCQLITHNNKLIRRNAVMALGVMATNGDVRNAVKKLDAIPPIIDKLSAEEDVVVHEYATLFLASLSADFICKIQIYEGKGLSPLIRLLSSPDPDVQKNSLEIIFNLVQDYNSRQAVHELGGILPLLELLKSDFPVIQHLVLKILLNVTIDKDTRESFMEEQGFERLMDILSNTDFCDLHAETLQVVANCLSDSESLHLIQEDGGLTRLMEFIRSPNSPEIQSNAVKCVSRVAQSSENRKLLNKQEVEKVLVELLPLPDTSVKTSTCQAVSAMSLNPPSRDIFRDLGAVPAVVQLLRDESLILREAATQALASLTHSNKLNAHAVYKAGGHEILVQQLCGSCPRTLANSAAALGYMAGQEVIRCSILSHGAMQALVEPLKSTNTQVLVSTTYFLAEMVCDTEARAELRSAGCIQPLVNLLHSHHKEVLQNACLAISVCASDQPTNVEMCTFGALEILQEINKSESRRSSFSKSAMITLLNFNLPVKYSVTGQLASTDHISDGFYDAGKVCAGRRILSLEELSKQPVNQHRPIIAVNTTADRETVAVPEEKQSNQAETDTSSKTDKRTLRTKKKDDSQKDDTQPEHPAEKPKQWKMMEDVPLQLLGHEAKESISPLFDEREQFVALARLVSNAMGGAVEVEKFPWELHLIELKFQLQSNVVPIGLIRMGIFCHRALLFKCLADSIGLSCTLVRGDYNRAWNEVLLFDDNQSRHGRSAQPGRYIVDLMHKPGSLLKSNTSAAEQYQTI